MDTTFKNNKTYSLVLKRQNILSLKTITVLKITIKNYHRYRVYLKMHFQKWNSTRLLRARSESKLNNVAFGRLDRGWGEGTYIQVYALVKKFFGSISRQRAVKHLRLRFVFGFVGVLYVQWTLVDRSAEFILYCLWGWSKLAFLERGWCCICWFDPMIGGLEVLSSNLKLGKGFYILLGSHGFVCVI